MKTAQILFIFLSIFTTQAWSKTLCSQKDVDDFRKAYVDMQNALRYEGKLIELKKNKIITSDKAPTEDAPGKKVEEALYNNYKNSLIKVQKIFQKLNKAENLSEDEKKIKAIPEVAEFFKNLDKTQPEKRALTINMRSLLEKLQKVKVPGFELNLNDTYLLENLIVHSQDRICTLSKYNPKNNANKVQYLEQLKREPLNKMIDALKRMPGTENLELANQDIAISQAVKNSLEKLRKLVREHKECEGLFKSPQILNEPIQGCNYKKFVNSLLLDDQKYSDFASILHFINANQLTTNARTSLDWINSQFKNEFPTTCYIAPESNKAYVQNLPFGEDKKKIDSSKFTCTDSSNKSLKGEACIKGINFEFEDGIGHKLTPKKDSNIQSVSISGSQNCESLPLRATSTGNEQNGPILTNGNTPPVTPPPFNRLRPENDNERTNGNSGNDRDTSSEDTPSAPPQMPPVIPPVTPPMTPPVTPPEAPPVAPPEAKPPQITPDRPSTIAVCSKDDCIDGKISPDKDMAALWVPEKNTCYNSNLEDGKRGKPICSLDGKNPDLESTTTPPETKPDRPDENKKSEEMTDEKCKKDNPKSKLNPEKKACEPIQETAVASSTKEEECNKKIDEDKDEETGRLLNNWSWDEKKKECVNKSDKKEKDEEDDEIATPAEKTYPAKQAPPRYQPMNMPSRQMFILPGLP